MGYLKLVILVLAYALISPAFAQICCSEGCAREGNQCVTTGPLWTRCIPIACAVKAVRRVLCPYGRPRRFGAHSPATHSGY